MRLKVITILFLELNFSYSYWRSGSSQTYKSCINQSLIKCIQKDSFGHTAIQLICRIYRKILCALSKNKICKRNAKCCFETFVVVFNGVKLFRIRMLLIRRRASFHNRVQLSLCLLTGFRFITPLYSCKKMPCVQLCNFSVERCSLHLRVISLKSSTFYLEQQTPQTGCETEARNHAIVQAGFMC